MCFGCSKEVSHRDGSFEYPQHMFWLRNKKNNFQLRTHFWGLGTVEECLTQDEGVAGSSLTGGTAFTVSLSKTLYSLLSTGSTQEDLSGYD